MTQETLIAEKLVHEAAQAETVHEAHELPNFLELLSEHFHHSSFFQFLHRWENLFFTLIAITLVSSVLLLAAKRKMLIPEGIRNLGEALVEGVENFVVGMMGEGGRKHVPFLGTLFFYILIMNYCGLFPLLKSPSSSWSTTLALALIAVVYIQVAGIRALGLKSYFHHIAGSPATLISWVIGVLLIFPLNLLLEYLAVPLSLSLRLFANISSEDRLLYKFAVMNVQSHWLAFPLQLFANSLSVLFSAIQAFVFALLTGVYIFTLMPHDEHHAEHSEETVSSH